MDDNTKQELIEHGKLFFSGLKQTWTGSDLAKIYELYNKIHGTNKTDNGCPSCRRSTINSVRDSYMEIKNSDQASAF